MKKPKKTKEKAWAIKGVYGFYYGTFSTRREAIEKHVYDLFWPMDHGGRKKQWDQCKKNGDSAVKVWIKEI